VAEPELAADATSCLPLGAEEILLELRLDATKPTSFLFLSSPPVPLSFFSL
jgi:hypothetical protein